MKTAQMKIRQPGPVQGHRDKFSHPPELTARPAHWLQLLTLLVALCSFFASSLSNADSLAAADTVFRFQSKMAERGHVASQYALAYMYESGQGTDKDLALAANWYRQAAQQGFVPAKDRLIYIDILNNGYQPQQQQQWLLKLKQTADDYNNKHQGESAFLLGQLYAAGLAVNKSLTMALRYLQLAEAANVIGSDSEIRRVETELHRLRESYKQTDSSNLQGTAKNDKAAADNRAATAQKQARTIKPPAETRAGKAAVKADNRANLKPAEPRSPQPARQTTPTTKHTAAAVKNTQAAPATPRPQPAPPVEQNSNTEQQEPHPMQVICSGWQRLDSACR